MKANGHVLRQPMFKSALKSLSGKKINVRGKVANISNAKLIKANSGTLKRIGVKEGRINEKLNPKLYNNIGNHKKIEIKPVAKEEIKIFNVDDLRFKDKNRNILNKKDRQDKIREKVLKNLNESKIARESSNYKEFAEFEKKFENDNKPKFNNAGEYYSHITDIGKRTDIDSKRKLELIQRAYESLGNAKGDITCISDIKYLKPEGFGSNGRPIVDWPKQMGFNVDSIKGITRENPLPNKWDRIGAMSGENFTTLPSSGKIFSFDERAIPYLENFQARHVGEFNNELYFDAIDSIKGNDLNKLNNIMKSNGIESVTNLEFKRLNSTYNDFINRMKSEIGNVDATYGLKGSAAPWKINEKMHMNGGAEQIVTPLTGDFLQRLGLLNIEF